MKRTRVQATLILALGLAIGTFSEPPPTWGQVDDEAAPFGWRITQIPRDYYEVDVWFTYSPDVSGSKIVWQEVRGVHTDIFIYDLLDGTQTRLTNTTDRNDFMGAISGSTVAWSTSRYYNPDTDGEVFLYDGTEITQLTNDDYENGTVRISGSSVVWTSIADWPGDLTTHEIFLYDGTQVLQLTDDTYHDHSPRISGSWVVWEGKDQSGNYEIFLYDGSDTIQLTDNNHRDRDPDVSWGRVVWVGKDQDGDSEVFLYDGTEITQLTDDGYYKSNTCISGSNIVWQAYDGHDNEIFLYDGTEIIQLTNNNRDDFNPEISRSTVVWESTGESSFDHEIFLAEPESIRMNGGWNIIGNDVYTDTPGNVGIGTAEPESKLHVKGWLKAGLLRSIRHILFNDATLPLDLWGDQIHDGHGFWGSQGSYRSSWAWNYYRNTPLNRIGVLGLNDYDNVAGIELGNEGILMRTAKGVLSGSTPPPVRVTVDPEGKVGVGTDKPVETLHIGRDGTIALKPRPTDPSPSPGVWKLYIHSRGFTNELRILSPEGVVNRIDLAP